MFTYSQILLIFPVIVTFIWFVSFAFSRPSFKNPRFIMALFMGCGFVTFLSGIGIYGGAIEIYKVIYPFVFFTALALFPLFFIYVIEIVRPADIKPKLLLHFLPAIILLLFSVSLYGIMMSSEEKLFFINDVLLNKQASIGELHWKYQLMYWVDATAKSTFIILSVLYYARTFWLVSRHQKKVEDYYSALKSVSLNWVRALGVVFVLALLSAIIIHWFHRSEVKESPFFKSVPFLFLGSFFAIVGNHSNRQSVSIFPSNNLEVDETENVSVAKELLENDRYNSHEDTNVPVDLKKRLDDYFVEYRPFLNPELKIWDIARDLNTNRTYVSRVINKEHGVRFSAFVNRYRVEEAKMIMRNPKTSHFSLIVVASMSGFLNYSSFVRAFRSIEGSAPNAFRKSAKT